MKAALLLTLSILFFVLTSNLPLAFSGGAEQVLDLNGKPIFPGGRYYLKLAMFGRAGSGVKLEKTGNSTCPVTVLQDFSETVNGLSVKLTIPGISTGIIFTGTPLDIAFEEKEKPKCATSSKWVVVFDVFPAKWVGIGGAQDHPAKKIILGSFNIQKYKGGYKLVFCFPTIDSPTSCFNVALADDEKGRRLILTHGNPFPVKFVDANA